MIIYYYKIFISGLILLISLFAAIETPAINIVIDLSADKGKDMQLLKIKIKVIFYFNGTAISPSHGRRLCRSDYTISPSRNLPDDIFFIKIN